MFHGGKYPKPEFLADLAKLIEPLQKTARGELQKAYKLPEVPQPIPEPIFRVFLSFDWNTQQPGNQFPHDWPEAELKGLVQSAALDGEWRVRSADTMRLLESKDFVGW